jgi:hypothetical protein
MVRDGFVRPDSPNNDFNYSIELTTLYGSTAVVMQAIVSQLEEKILGLKNKYKIEEVGMANAQIMSREK